MVFMQEQGAKAMDEQVYNKLVKGKKNCGEEFPEDDTKCYEEALKQYLPGDWSNEFQVTGPDRRDNKSHHETWDSINSKSEYLHFYTNDDEEFTMKPCTHQYPPIRCEDGLPWDAQ